MNKVRLLKSADGVIGKALVSLLSMPRRSVKNSPLDSKKILIIRPGGIGDAVLLLPAISALREKFPDSTIDVLCEKRNAGIFSLHSGLRRVYLYDRDMELLRCLRNSYDVVIDTEQWHRLSAVAARLTGARVRIGFDTNERGKLFTHRIPYSHDNYEVYSFLHLIEPLTGAVHDFMPDEAFVDIPGAPPSLLSSELRSSGNLVAIFPGATVAERRWGADNYGKVAQALSDKGYIILILGSQTEEKDAKTIRKHASDAIDLTGKTDLRDVAALLKSCRLLITADSGLLHIAYAAGTQTVSLFGAGIEKKWAPIGKRHRVLNKHVGCSPCTRFGYTPACKRNVECLLLVSPGEVLQAVEAVLGS